ncbi:arsenate reductase (glutaredoxin) [Chitinivorax sp. PXF-14]|uniref:arsenate reductase (glutaredoxin) n=1 Tax=Chitinivorax sp. PXF-14 TaxID=3230488 RepID=UPI00346699D4
MTVRIYHNPRCSKSRQTLALLTEHGETPEIIEYLQTPPSADELRHLLSLLGIAPRELMRTDEDEYRELGLDAPSLSSEQLIDAMVAHPRLIQRPIVVYGERAAIGRPPENVLALLGPRS